MEDSDYYQVANIHMHLCSHLGIVLALTPSVVAIGLKFDFRLHEEVFFAVLNSS